jgi:hypothetical protein
MSFAFGRVSHACPHAPQCSTSDDTFTHLCSHQSGACSLQ